MSKKKNAAPVDLATVSTCYLDDVICTALKTRPAQGPDQPAERERLVRDSAVSGIALYLRIAASGTKSWFCRFTNTDGKRDRKHLGLYKGPGMLKAVVSLAEARKLAEETRDKVALGIDPNAAEAPKEAPMTFNQLIERRIEKQVAGVLKTEGEIRYVYEKYIGSVIGEVPVIEFDRKKHYDMVIDPYFKKKQWSTVKKAHGALCCLMTFAVDEVPGIQFDMMAGKKWTNRCVPRDHTLGDDEIRKLWTVVREVFAYNPSIYICILLELILGQRTNEIAGMRRSEYDLDCEEPFWIIPGDKFMDGQKIHGRTKNGREHMVPLPPLAVQLIREAEALTPNGDILFPKIKNPCEPMDPAFVPQQIAAKRAAAKKAGEPDPFGIRHWGTHDLRRTMSTIMNRELGVSGFDVSLLINHAMKEDGHNGNTPADRNNPNANRPGSKVTQRHYLHHAYLAPRRAAMAKWNDWLQQVLGNNILPFPVAA